MKFSIVNGALAIALAAPLAFPAQVRAQDEGQKKATDEKPPEKKADDQPKKPDDNGGGNRGGGPGGGGRRGGGFGRMFDSLKEDLKLTPEQVEKLDAVQEEMRAMFRKMRDDMGGGGPPGPEFRQKFQDMQKDIRAKIRAFLTDEQKTKFDELTKKMDERMAQGGGPGGPGGFGRDPEARKKQLIADAEKALALSAEEKSAIMPLVEKAIDAKSSAKQENDKRREEFLAFVKKGGASEEVKSKLDEYRKARDAESDKAHAAQKALRDVLTIEQEAKLVALGILD